VVGGKLILSPDDAVYFADMFLPSMITYTLAEFHINNIEGVAAAIQFARECLSKERDEKNILCYKVLINKLSGNKEYPEANLFTNAPVSKAAAIEGIRAEAAAKSALTARDRHACSVEGSQQMRLVQMPSATLLGKSMTNGVVSGDAVSVTPKVPEAGDQVSDSDKGVSVDTAPSENRNTAV
jgi:hypothetical protein